MRSTLSDGLGRRSDGLGRKLLVFGGPVAVELHYVPTVWEKADAKP